FLAGERLDPETYWWAGDLLRIPVVDHWWQTETGWPVAANPLGLEQLPAKAGSPTVPVPGWDVRVLDPSDSPVPPDVDGALVMKLPLPPGALPTLWRDDERYVSSYLSRYPGFYLSGDGGHVDPDGYLFVMGRMDDVINVAGHRLSTGAMEEVLAGHPAVADVEPSVVSEQLVQRVRTEIGAVASLRRIDVVAALPKTRSGKILRGSMRAIADGVEQPVPSTIEDPAVLDALRPTLRS